MLDENKKIPLYVQLYEKSSMHIKVCHRFTGASVEKKSSYKNLEEIGKIRPKPALQIDRMTKSKIAIL